MLLELPAAKYQGGDGEAKRLGRLGFLQGAAPWAPEHSVADCLHCRTTGFTGHLPITSLSGTLPKRARTAHQDTRDNRPRSTDDALSGPVGFVFGRLKFFAGPWVDQLHGSLLASFRVRAAPARRCTAPSLPGHYAAPFSAAISLRSVHHFSPYTDRRES